MGLIYFRESNQIQTKQVPYLTTKKQKFTSLSSLSLVLLILLFTLLGPLRGEQQFDYGPATSLYDFYLEQFSDSIEPSSVNLQISTNRQQEGQFNKPTPPIDPSGTPDVIKSSKWSTQDYRGAKIKPANVQRQHFVEKVYKHHLNNELDETDLFSPVFYLRSSDPLESHALYYSESLDPYQNDAQPAADAAATYSDLIDPGSGNFENPSPTEGESTNLLEESIVHNEYDQSFGSFIASTQVQAQIPLSFTPTPAMINDNNQAPLLQRRLPRLAVTAGQVWKYFIPSDTFIDEDGDLRKLRSTIVRKNNNGRASNKLNSSNATTDSTTTYNQLDSAHYYSWVQYDASSQLLYGLPTDNDAGRHELILVVGDRFGATSQEIIEIHVRQHQSSRAFTHQFMINNIYWDPDKFPSMVDALGELVKQISTRIFMDRAFENFIVQHYTINDQAISSNSASSQDNRRMSFNLAWSNSSTPIHPCNIGQVENLFRTMINTQFLRPDWSSDSKVSLAKIPPSVSMLRILEPDFKPESVSVNLLGSCDSKELFNNNTLIEHDNSDSAPKVQVKIGRLSWKLGQPIEYRVPIQTFSSDRGAYTTRDLQLSLHTIDGLTLDKDPKYSFIDFDQENQIIFGLPFSQEDHTGQRELQMTARHPKSGYKAREVFIMNIESQDLTTINNRAFQMSLYFHVRSRSFGPQERVALSRKIISATGGESADSSVDKRSQQITVMNIAKNINRAQLASAVQGNFDGDFVDITRFDQRNDMTSLEFKDSDVAVYKYSWTNESIGNLGDCPVEVIKENILYSLEQSMLDFRAPSEPGRLVQDQQNKSDSVRFFERLRLYFEPELDLAHLRFEPLGACISAMELHDVGNSDLADMIDRASELDTELNQEQHPPPVLQTTAPKIDSDAGNEEYWSIVVLLVLVVTLIFVIIMFFMGMHTYKINQDKRFEMQVKLAQARQNSMYLSSMILANLASPNDCGSAAVPNMNRNMCIVQNEEKGSRKPVILDNEKKLFNATLPTTNEPRSMAVQLDGSSVRTTPLKPNSTVTLDSMASIGWQPSLMGLSMSPSALLYTPMEGKHRTMTLNRRSSAQRQIQFPPQTLNHSQSILTVASIAGPVPVMSQGNMPLVYTPVLSVIPGSNVPYNYALPSAVHKIDREGSLTQTRVIGANQLTSEEQQVNQVNQVQQIPLNGLENPNYDMGNTKMKSSSHSSSMSATTNSVISNPNYSPHR